MFDRVLDAAMFKLTCVFPCCRVTHYVYFHVTDFRNLN